MRGPRWVKALQPLPWHRWSHWLDRPWAAILTRYYRHVLNRLLIGRSQCIQIDPQYDCGSMLAIVDSITRTGVECHLYHPASNEPLSNVVDIQSRHVVALRAGIRCIRLHVPFGYFVRVGRVAWDIEPSSRALRPPHVPPPLPVHKSRSTKRWE